MIGRTAVMAAAALAAGAAGWGGAPGRAHAVGEPCGPYKRGVPGVVQTFCKGPATVSLTVNGKASTLKGGECSTSSMGFSLNLGVVSTGELKPKPDYIGLLAPVQSGAFQRATLSVTTGGKTILLTKNSGTVGPKGGAFSGTGLSGEAVKATFTC